MEMNRIDLSEAFFSYSHPSNQPEIWTDSYSRQMDRADD